MTTERLLLDTCAVIWMAIDAELDAAATDRIDEAVGEGVDVAVCPITAWELGVLAAKGRLPATQSPADLFGVFVDQPGIVLEGLTPAMLIGSSFLPGSFHKDPVDRIIVAMARALDMTVVTRDRAILEYAKQGFVRALAC
jgi:PIN domain nuclease of toxin-antitoxin system